MSFIHDRQKTDNHLTNTNRKKGVFSSMYQAVGDIKVEFEQHDDPDVIIPYHIARKTTFVTSWLLLVSGVVALCTSTNSNDVIIGILLLVVWLTSIIHWYQPHFSTIIRKLDFIAVFSAIGYGTYYAATDVSNSLKLLWFVGLGIITIVFITNESLYYVSVMKLPTGRDLESPNTTDSDNINNNSNDNKDCCTKLETQPNSASREFVYWRTAITHAVCVHILANCLVMIIILS